MTSNNAIQIQHNTAEILSAFNRLLERSDNLAPVMQAIEGVLADASERAFDEESSPNHDPWQDLTEVTKAMRKGKGYWPGQILQRSGRLAASIETDSDDLSATIGTNAVYAAIQFWGGTTSAESMIPNKEIPSRKFMGLGPEDEDDILGDLIDHLSGAV
ncbi:MAG: phage virion morphogenesis protein [Marinomonas sp.]|uniref:phage virion morphogenesis protein n=1 Tax=Marinomonas sp. TaxID=1904862 RepID=UPI003F98EF31